MADKSCSVAGCQRPHYANGICLAHYQRMYRHGEVMADRPIIEKRRRCWRVPKDARCRSPVCDRPVRARGLCEAHYKRLMRTNRPNLAVKVRRYGKKKGDSDE